MADDHVHVYNLYSTATGNWLGFNVGGWWQIPGVASKCRHCGRAEDRHVTPEHLEAPEPEPAPDRIADTNWGDVF